MRVTTPGIHDDQGDDEALCFDGRTIPVAASDSVASAMIAAGERGNRADDSGGRRGVWCGMGVCHECAVRIDGEDSRLACMTPARDGQIIETQPTRRRVPAASPQVRPETEIAPDVLVIGAGPAGLVAATDLAEAGLDVLLVDDRPKLGGQYYKQPDPAFRIDEHRLDGQYTAGRRLIRAAQRSGVRTLLGTTVWAAFEPDRLLARSEQERWIIRPRRVVIAAGAYERGVPIPGWTLPGVMTTGAGQTLLRSYQVSPGDRVLVAGNGPLNVQLAAELARGGVNVVALVEAARIFSPRRAAAVARMALAVPGLTVDGVRYLAELTARRVPIITGAAVVQMEGDPVDGVSRVRLGRIDDEGRMTRELRSFDVDAVCLGYGFLPGNDLARSLGCRHVVDAGRGALRTVTDDNGRTSIPSVFAIGDAAGVRGAKFAQAQAKLAAAAIRRDLRGEPSAALEKAAVDARRQAAFQKAVNTLFAAPLLTDQLARADTVVCRCEGTTHGDLAASMAEGLTTAGAVKRVTRAGMGKCQGRYCGPVLTAMQSARTGAAVAERSGFAPQAPVKPVPLGDVARG